MNYAAAQGNYVKGDNIDFLQKYTKKHVLITFLPHSYFNLRKFNSKIDFITILHFDPLQIRNIIHGKDQNCIYREFKLICFGNEIVLICYQQIISIEKQIMFLAAILN